MDCAAAAILSLGERRERRCWVIVDEVKSLYRLPSLPDLMAEGRGFGKEIAVAAGLRYSTADATVLMDSDLQHPPEVIPEFIARWREASARGLVAARAALAAKRAAKASAAHPVPPAGAPA